MMVPVLTAEHIVGGYRNRQVLHDVTFRVDAAERLLLIGPNGCGKTTLLRILVGLLKSGGGRILLGGQELSSVPPYRRMRCGIGYLMQTQNIFPSLTVDENLELSYWYGDGEYRARRDQLLTFFPLLKDRLSRRSGLLSGGERQALAVCMVMMRPARLLLLDEPTAGLAPKAAEEILESIQEAQRALKFACVIVEHNLRLVLHWVSRVVIMKHGQIAGEETEPSALSDHNRLQRYYFE